MRLIRRSCYFCAIALSLIKAPACSAKGIEGSNPAGAASFRQVSDADGGLTYEISLGSPIPDLILTAPDGTQYEGGIIRETGMDFDLLARFSGVWSIDELVGDSLRRYNFTIPEISLASFPAAPALSSPIPGQTIGTLVEPVLSEASFGDWTTCVSASSMESEHVFSECGGAGDALGFDIVNRPAGEFALEASNTSYSGTVKYPGIGDLLGELSGLPIVSDDEDFEPASLLFSFQAAAPAFSVTVVPEPESGFYMLTLLAFVVAAFRRNL